MSPQFQDVVPPPPSNGLPPREAEALLALGSTRVSPGTRALLVFGFLTICFSGIVTSGWETISTRGEEAAPVAKSVFRELFSSGESVSAPPGSPTLWRFLPSPAAFRRAEKNLENHSFIASRLRPRLQAFLFQTAGIGNEQVEPAPGGWLFFRRDLDYLNGRPFLNNAQMGRARSPSLARDSVTAICDFNAQLASRGIRLLVVPVPVKPCIEAHRFHPVRNPAATPLQNASYAAWLGALEAEGVAVFDPGPLLLERARSTGEPQFLRTDTHWTPEAMEAVAGAVALKIVSKQASAAPHSPSMRPMEITAHGDTVALLGLSKDQTLLAPQTVLIHQAAEQSAVWKPDPGADVLLLGDSFSNIYSLGAMGWGEGAGFAEHLSAQLGRPVDAILRNSDGAFATRQMLQKELVAGKDRLAGKSVVVWEFAVRELVFGDWKSLPLSAPSPRKPTFFSPPSGAKQRISGVVANVAAIPRPGAVPYKEHIVALHLVNVVPDGERPEKPFECVVYTWSMRDQQPTAAAGLRPGTSVSAELLPWDDVSDALEKFQRSDLSEPALLLEPANWAEAFR